MRSPTTVVASISNINDISSGVEPSVTSIIFTSTSFSAVTRSSSSNG
jgi:hypothetical protein